MESLATLFEGYDIKKPDVKVSRPRSERSELIKYFYENAKTSWMGKKPLQPSYIGFRLSHLKLEDLYAFKSMCEDRSRSGYSWSKFFWGNLKEQSWR